MSTNFKSIKAERTTETRDIKDLESHGTGNIFETIVALSKRSNQVAMSKEKELAEKLEEFVIPTDSLEEVFENREQIEISSSTSVCRSRTALQSKNCKTSLCTSQHQLRTKRPKRKLEFNGHALASSPSDMTLHGRRIVLGITGSIAAYKSAVLARELRRRGADVRVVMTPGATEFITPLTLATLVDHPVHSDFTEDQDAGVWTNHVELGDLGGLDFWCSSHGQHLGSHGSWRL